MNEAAAKQALDEVAPDKLITESEVSAMKFKTDQEVKSEVLEAVKAKTAEGGWISCAVAREIAEEQGVAPIVVGKACDLLKIRIKSCVLGCFE